MNASPEQHEIVEAFRVDPRWAKHNLLLCWGLYFVLNLIICIAVIAWCSDSVNAARFIGCGSTIYFSLRGFLYYKQLVGCCIFVTKDSLLLVRHLHHTCNVSVKSTPLPLRMHEDEDNWLMNDLAGDEVHIPKQAYPAFPERLEAILRRLRNGEDLPSTSATI